MIKKTPEERAAIRAGKVAALYMQLRFLKQVCPNLITAYTHDMGRICSNIIFDLPHEWTGYESKLSIERKKTDSNYSPTYEHFYSRQVSGNQLVQDVLDNKITSLEEFARQIREYCQVHKVTREQNISLKQYMSSDIPWTEAYRQANIKLIQVMDLTTHPEKAPWELLLRSVERGNYVGADEVKDSITMLNLLADNVTMNRASILIDDTNSIDIVDALSNSSVFGNSRRTVECYDVK